MIWQLFVTTFNLIVKVVGEALCPGGACSKYVCYTYNGTQTCTYGINLFFRWFFITLTQIIQYIFPIIFATIYFIIDMSLITGKVITNFLI